MRGREKQTSALYNSRGKRGKQRWFRATVTCEQTVNIARLLHCLSLFLFCLEVSSLAPSRLMSKQKEAMKNKVTSNFIILYKSAKATEASLCLRGLQPDQSTRPLKWTLLIKYCSASLPVSCQSPPYTEKMKMSSVQEPQKFHCDKWITNASLHVPVCARLHIFSVPVTTA